MNSLLRLAKKVRRKIYRARVEGSLKLLIRIRGGSIVCSPRAW